MGIKDATAHARGLQSWRARWAFGLSLIAERARLPDWVRKRLNREIHGRYVGAAGVFDLRPNSWDAATVHPGHEKATHVELRRLLVGSGGTMIDIGGHCGSFGLRYRELFHHIVILEPAPANADAIERNIALSGVGHKVSLVRAAAASSNGKSTFYLMADDTHSLVPSVGRQTIEVETVTLDSYMRLKGALLPSLRLLKIDVEGAEVEVLSGAIETLVRSKPLVVAEANSTEELERLRAFMAGLGYELHIMTDARNAIFKATA